MADTVTSALVAQTKTHYAIHLTGISDGSGESNITKIDKSTLTDFNGVEPAALDLDQIWWAVQGYASIVFKWQHTSDVTMVALPSGIGYLDFRCHAEMGIGLYESGGLKDSGTGSTGDVRLTSNGATATSTYDIFAIFKKRIA